MKQMVALDSESLRSDDGGLNNLVYEKNRRKNNASFFGAFKDYVWLFEFVYYGAAICLQRSTGGSFSGIRSDFSARK